MDLAGRMAGLYEKATPEAYKNLQALEALSDREDTLYPHVEEFIAMLGSAQYAVRVRGFRLLCKQARWDTAGKLDAAIGTILAAVNDERPTAVRQALQALEDVVLYKSALRGEIREMALALDYTRFKDTMQPLIAKDIATLVALIDAQA